MDKKIFLLVILSVNFLVVFLNSPTTEFWYRKFSKDPFWHMMYLKNDIYGTKLEKTVSIIGPGFEVDFNKYPETFERKTLYEDFSEKDFSNSDLNLNNSAVTVISRLFYSDGKKLHYLEVDPTNEESVKNALEYSKQINSDIVLLDFETKYSLQLEEQIKKMDAIFIAPAGDDGTKLIDFPASVENVISIGAFDIDNNLWPDNNISEKNLYFPGVHINNGIGNIFSTTRIAASIATWYIVEMIQYDENISKDEIIENIKKINKKEAEFEDFFIIE